jgi:hypothetical protein
MDVCRSGDAAYSIVALSAISLHLYKTWAINENFIWHLNSCHEIILVLTKTGQNAEFHLQALVD